MGVIGLVTKLNTIYDQKTQIEQKIRDGGNSFDEQHKMLDTYRLLQEKEIKLKKQFASARLVNYDTL